MLRNEVQVALHDLLDALRESADLYTDDADVLSEGELAKLCRELALRRERLADALADEVRRSGDLPTEPDPDRETLHRLGNRLRAMFSHHERDAVVRDRLDAEDTLLRLADHALSRLGDPATRQLVEEISRDSAQARMALGQFAES